MRKRRMRWCPACKLKGLEERQKKAADKKRVWTDAMAVVRSKIDGLKKDLKMGKTWMS